MRVRGRVYARHDARHQGHLADRRPEGSPPTARASHPWELFDATGDQRECTFPASDAAASELTQERRSGTLSPLSP